MRSALLLFLLTDVATAAPAPCDACVLEVPKGDKPAPLLVVLHGDRERASTAAERWSAAARERGWAVFAPQCPKTEGCGDSWWKWDGDPGWLRTQIAELRKTVKVDPASIVLVGWSGGATYLGRHAATWTETFSAVVVHGGGQAPADATCSPRPLPAYFLVGDKNPLHGLMKDLRAYFDACKQDVTWDLVAGGDHDREERALDKKKALAILDWAAGHARKP